MDDRQKEMTSPTFKTFSMATLAILMFSPTFVLQPISPIDF
jgi:hypothetical protein